NGKKHVPFPESLDTLDGKLAWMKEQFEKGETRNLSDIAQEIAQFGDPKTIPLLIGIIDADNSYDTVYGVGYFGLGREKLGELTGVRYSPYHDGAWWRRWWEANKSRFPEEIRNTPVPDLPKTEDGKKHVPFPESLDTLDGKLALLKDQFEQGNLRNLSEVAMQISAHGEPKAIPMLIGVIDADNSYDTVYGVGYCGLGFDKLGELTGARYSPYHDGAWWRRWWEANKSRFPKEAQDIPIPDLPKTENGKKHVPFPDSLDTLDGKLVWLKDHFVDGSLTQADLWKIAQEIAQHGDPKAIPLLIGVIDADNTYNTVYGVGYFGLGYEKLGEITGVTYSEDHDGAWWRRWWDENKSRFPKEVQDIPIPDLPKTAKKLSDNANHDADVESELADVPSQEIRVGDDANKRYFLIGPKANAQPPQTGFKLAIVMPGGDGGVDFNPFVRRVLKNALGPEWLIAEPVAVNWTPTQEIVWPTELTRVEGQQFSTEAFVESVIADVKGRHPIDAKHIVTLTWSSSGPAAYAIALQPTTSITGSYIAMSVFKPDFLPPLTNAKGRRFHIEHSPDDRVCPYAHAQAAREQLTQAEATVHSTDYEGGHGWRGNVFGRIREGMEWLTTN
ncbi:MAG: hypothetical protein WC655_20920, partial [Candidatus Hydrogenedentales bacterium]